VTLWIARWIACWVGLALLACKTPMPPASAIVTQHKLAGSILRGPGAEYCAPLNGIGEMVGKKNYSGAEAAVDQVIAKFDVYVAASNGIAVTAPSQLELDQIRATSAQPDRLVPVDWCYRDALHVKAFLHTDRGDFSGALPILDVEIRVAPTAADPLVERGYALNRLGRPAEGKDSYERALALAEKFEYSAPLRPIALRGLGFSLTDLGDFEGAKAAYEQSLALDPDNELARKELSYIEQQRAKAR
jgi:tetratricopeptide (TPR) repeat protein